MKKVIVTGGAGFIGSNLCKILAKNSYQPIIVDNFSTGFRELVKYGELIEADCGDYDKMTEIFKKHKPLAVFHIAAFKDVAESISNPFKYYQNNVGTTNSLLQACVDSGIEHFIFSSSAAIYGEIKGDKKVDENHEAKPINPYGRSKLMAEEIIRDFSVAHNLIFSNLRYFNVSGADPDGELGEMNEDAKNIFPILSKAVNQNREFQIFGQDYDTKDGSCVRDYIHVYDLAFAHLQALEKQIETKKSATINLGNGEGFSVIELVKNFEEISGKKLNYSISNRRKGDPACVVANIAFAQDYLGFNPRFPEIQDHIKHHINWHQKTFQND